MFVVVVVVSAAVREGYRSTNSFKVEPEPLEIEINSSKKGLENCTVL